MPRRYNISFGQYAPPFYYGQNEGIIETYVVIGPTELSWARAAGGLLFYVPAGVVLQPPWGLAVIHLWPNGAAGFE